jgi:hypothetical protein
VSGLEPLLCMGLRGVSGQNAVSLIFGIFPVDLGQIFGRCLSEFSLNASEYLQPNWVINYLSVNVITACLFLFCEISTSARLVQVTYSKNWVLLNAAPAILVAILVRFSFLHSSIKPGLSLVHSSPESRNSGNPI